MGIVDTAVREVVRDGIRQVHQASERNGRQAAPKQEASELAALPPGITGAMVLDDARAFAATVLHATDEQLDALVLACAVSHTIESFTTVPRILATAPQKQSGKTTLLNLVTMLGFNAWKSKATAYALRSKFNSREKPLVIVDEISRVFGRSGLRGSGNNDLATILLEGYACDATLSMSVDRESIDVSSYCLAAIGGLGNAVPEDIWSRCIEWKMKPKPPGVTLRDSLDEDTRTLGCNHGERVHQWARGSASEIKQAFRTFRRPHRKMDARLRQVWGPLYATALVAGENWPARCLAAFKVMGIDVSDTPVLSDTQMVIKDAAALFETTGADRLFAATIRDYLWSLPDVEMYEKLTPRGLAQVMTDALGQATSMDIGEARARGYHAKPVLAAWTRLEAQLEPPAEEEEEEDEYDLLFEVTQITEDGAA